MERARAIPVAEVLKERRRLPWYIEMWVRLVLEKPLGTIGAVLVLAMVLMAILADVVAPYGYNQSHMEDKLSPQSTKYWMGTDLLGRDLMSRVIFGARISMYVGMGAVVLGTTAATLLGLVSGYFGGKLDASLQRIVDAWMSFPFLLILLTIMSIIGPGVLNIIYVLGLAFTFSNSRIVRGAVLSVKENMYIEAARSLGCGHFRMIARQILPNVMAPIIIIATLGLGNAILLEASMSFLGLGIPPPTPSWGQMLSFQGRQYMYIAPWLAIWPGVALSLAVFGFNMLGDALRDILDPRLRGAGGRF